MGNHTTKRAKGDKEAVASPIESVAAGGGRTAGMKTEDFTTKITKGPVFRSQYSDFSFAPTPEGFCKRFQ